MLFGHHQGVPPRRLGNVEDGQDVIVLVDFDGRDLPRDDLAENVFHGYGLLKMKKGWLWATLSL
jgi:hypothetical protein